MGFLKIQTYILEEEHGVTLVAAGWENKGVAGGGQWKHTDGKPRRTDQPIGMKTRWERILNDQRPVLSFSFAESESAAELLFAESHLAEKARRACS